MTRVYVVAEGRTEVSFINEMLIEALWPHGVYLTPLLLGRTGGHPTYARVKTDVVTQLKQDRSAYCSTMLDFYGLGDDFPGKPLPANLPSVDKALRIEQAVKADIVKEFPDLRPDSRFLPYLQLHEYEGLLFSDPVAFARGINQSAFAAAFQKIRAEFQTPEEINDRPDKAPSKRVAELYQAYKKPFHGVLAALEIGITVMRQQCPHFRSWLEQLEALAE